MSNNSFVAALMRQVNERVAAEAEEAGQMTLGGLIAALKVLPGYKPVLVDVGGSLGEPDSYRGFYEQLAFEPVTEFRSVAEVLADAEEARGKTFTGYKGGDFKMTGSTLIWVSKYGQSGGPRIIGVEDTPDAVVILTKPYEG